MNFNLEVLGESTNQTMSSLDIAELTGKQHKDVLYDIRNMLEQLDKAVADFSATAFYEVNNAKRSREIFNLPKRECLILVSGYNTQMRAKIIDRWQELEQKALPKHQAIALDPVIRSNQIAEATFRTLSVFGIDKNSAIISASQVGFAHTGVNIYKDAQLVLEAPNQKSRSLTPTQLGSLKGISAVKMNKLLEKYTLQEKIKDIWQPTTKALPYCKVVDTAKKSSSGTIVQQILWYENVLELIKE